MPDEENVLSIPVVEVISPCEECGKSGVNLKYSLVGLSGVLCRKCLEAVINQVNFALTETAKEDNQEVNSNKKVGLNMEPCVNCDIAVDVEYSEEGHLCMICGGALCEACYDASPYCEECEKREI